VPLIDVPTAKRELRVTHDAEDAEIARKLAAAEEQAAAYLGRGIYATPQDLAAARAAAPPALAAALVTYDAAMAEAAGASTYYVRDLQERAAKAAYGDAIDGWQRAMRGMVANESVRTAILLITASLWEHRGDEDAIAGIPPAAERFLWPFRIGIGV
jgi:hypothetical protein